MLSLWNVTTWSASFGAANWRFVSSNTKPQGASACTIGASNSAALPTNRTIGVSNVTTYSICEKGITTGVLSGILSSLATVGAVLKLHIILGLSPFVSNTSTRKGQGFSSRSIWAINGTKTRPAFAIHTASSSAASLLANGAPPFIAYESFVSYQHHRPFSRSQAS